MFNSKSDLLKIIEFPDIAAEFLFILRRARVQGTQNLEVTETNCVKDAKSLIEKTPADTLRWALQNFQ